MLIKLRNAKRHASWSELHTSAHNGQTVATKCGLNLNHVLIFSRVIEPGNSYILKHKGRNTQHGFVGGRDAAKNHAPHVAANVFHEIPGKLCGHWQLHRRHGSWPYHGQDETAQSIVACLFIVSR